MKNLPLFIIFVFCITAYWQNVKAQAYFNNNFSFRTTVNILPADELRVKSLFNEYTLEYSHSYNKFRISTSFSWWNNSFLTGQFYGASHKYISDTSEWIGSLQNRWKYKFVDIDLFYRIVLNKKLILNVGVGPSFTWGVNSYVKGYYYSSGIPDYVMWFESKNENRIGGNMQIVAKYFLLNNRMDLQAIFKKSYYPDYFSQFETGLGIGLNF
ncbi:MAG: hypothetical protein ABIQ74_04900 [Chitinophagales bacterium]